ncbi:MAG: site-specific DNA-methyltransferase, partial [Deltaproteobacteria bacterium]|nr:site-specific DNA-methyltransferase [Deltaproteobacteria bacterium]
MPTTEQLRSRLINKLTELFQLDQPDLDFGFYRVMHAKAREVQTFIDKDLLGIISAAFSSVDETQKKELQATYDSAVKMAMEFGAPNPLDTEPVKKAKAALDVLKDTAGAEADVYDHLYRFFERYYEDGDFISRRYYTRETSGKAAPYAIPYNGEEVKLHWANADQYYVKSTEYFSNFSFDLSIAAREQRIKNGDRIFDGEIPDDLRVLFKIVDATEGEHGNVKASDTSRRFFLLHPTTPVVEGENGELVIQFEYRPDPDKSGQEGVWQTKRNAETVERILSILQKDPPHTRTADYLGLLNTPAPTEKEKKRPLLAKYITQYTSRNTMDYFIHKDLGGFLQRELDFYIKNEVMHLDDIENADAPTVESYLSKIRVLRKIAGKLIEFLAQLEEFQKKLWLKKKFVVETNYCITLDRVPESLYPQIIENDAQLDEWIKLFAIDEIEAGDKDLLSKGAPGFTRPLTVEFLKANDKLVLDTRFFSEDFKATLIASLDNFDNQCDGLLIHSENFQALNLLQERYREQVKCVYIDPPYNTGGDGFAYKDSYQHSSWMAMMTDRLGIARNFFEQNSIFFSSIDDNESAGYRFLLDSTFGEKAFECAMAWVKRYAPPPDVCGIGYVHETIFAYAPCGKFQAGLLPMTDEQKGRYDNPDGDARGPWKAADYTCRYTAEERPTLYYPITNPHTGQEIWPKRSRVWAMSQDSHRNNVQENRVWWGKNGTNTTPALKNFIGKIKQGIAPSSILSHHEVGHTDEAAKELRNFFPGIKLTPKPTRLIQRLGTIANLGDSNIILDFFVGSGTTGHAV